MAGADQGGRIGCHCKAKKGTGGGRLGQKAHERLVGPLSSFVSWHYISSPALKEQ